MSKDPSSPSPLTTAIPSRAGFNLIELTTPSGLRIELLPSGAVFAVRHGSTQINQVLPGPAEDGLLRVFVRWQTSSGWQGAPVVSSLSAFAPIDRQTAAWRSSPLDGLEVTTTLRLCDDGSGWSWRIQVVNTALVARVIDVIVVQDLGLADEAAVRNSEAYTSQYIDLLPVRDATWGWTVLARQNRAMTGGRFPWLGLACPSGAVAFGTDGNQVFGLDHRLTNRPSALAHGLPSQRVQGEVAVAALQSEPREIGPGVRTEIDFIAAYQPDHPEISSEADLVRLQALAATRWAAPPSEPEWRLSTPSLFARADWLHGQVPTEAELTSWYPGQWRHEERAPDGRVWSFFAGNGVHVVTRDKEVMAHRQQGHILRSGTALELETDQFGVTGFAAGVFGTQAYYANTNLGRLVSVVRHPLNVMRASGQRIFVRTGEGWQQLGVPSVFEMRRDEISWRYQLPAGECVVVRAWCSAETPASFLRVEIVGEARALMVTHNLVLGAVEYDHGGKRTDQPDGWVMLAPAPESPLNAGLPEAVFAIAVAEVGTSAQLVGAEALYDHPAPCDGPYVVARAGPRHTFGVILAGAEGAAALTANVARARRDYASMRGPRERSGAAYPDDGYSGLGPAKAPLAPVRLAGRDAAVARVDEVLPWFTHNAWIHFSAPHGLEQTGGAAWGVRDVCQGSIEWLLTAGAYPTARSALATVFARQFPRGDWPQWFMHDPFRWIQPSHSHGDVCFWPVKALCDYVEASNDLSILHWKCRYASSENAQPVGEEETLLAHCGRVLAHMAERFMSGTTLVNYGDGDWDDTLQPADPAMRTRMISAWTVGLAYHTLRQLLRVCQRVDDGAPIAQLESLLAQMRADFRQHLMRGGVVAGFLIHEDAGRRVLLHPDDTVTGIRYRLLPMTRAILAELFDRDEAARHLGIIRQTLSYPDGARLMSAPARYHGGREHLFKRGDSAAHVGREIGLQYVHAHLRYAEALAKVGDAHALWHALQVVNPVGIQHVVPNAEMRQANVYFSSSDADFPDRYVAAERWEDLRTGGVAVRGGWRLYSSGPGLYLHRVRSSLLGIRESFEDVVVDPVLPPQLDGLVADTLIDGRSVRFTFAVRRRSFAPHAIKINGIACDVSRREPNPYREGGVRLSRPELAHRLVASRNSILVEL